MRNGIRNTKAIVAEEVQLPARYVPPVHLTPFTPVTDGVSPHVKDLSSAFRTIVVQEIDATAAVTETELYAEVSAKITAAIRTLLRAGSLMR